MDRKDLIQAVFCRRTALERGIFCDRSSNLLVDPEILRDRLPAVYSKAVRNLK